MGGLVFSGKLRPGAAAQAEGKAATGSSCPGQGKSCDRGQLPRPREKLRPGAVHVTMPFRSKFMQRRPGRDELRTCEFIACLAKEQAEGRKLFSADVPLNVHEDVSSSLAGTFGRPHELRAPWKHAISVGCGFNLVAAPRHGGISGPALKEKQWIANWDHSHLETHCKRAWAVAPSRYG